MKSAVTLAFLILLSGTPIWAQDQESGLSVRFNNWTCADIFIKPLDGDKCPDAFQTCDASIGQNERGKLILASATFPVSVTLQVDGAVRRLIALLSRANARRIYLAKLSARLTIRRRGAWMILSVGSVMTLKSIVLASKNFESRAAFVIAPSTSNLACAMPDRMGLMSANRNARYLKRCVALSNDTRCGMYERLSNVKVLRLSILCIS